MNIIVDTSTIQPEMSGTGYYTQGMLHELLKMPSIDTIHALGGNLDLFKKAEPGKIIHHFPDQTNWHRLINIKMAANRPNIRGDVAIFPNYFIPPGFPIPSIATIHDLSFLSHPKYYSWKMRTFYRHRIKHTFAAADKILTVSEESKKQITDYSKRSDNEVISIPPGPSLPLENATEKPIFLAKYFLWNGNIEARKNVLPTIRAFLEANLTNYHLVIAGKQFCGKHYWNEFTGLVEQSNRIHYLGYIDNHELKQWYTGAQGVVCCSFVEGFGIPIANARSMGLPCLISNHPALEEAAGPQAIKVNPNDQNGIIRGFKELAKLPAAEGQSKTSLYAREHDLYWQRFSSQLEEVLQETTLNVKRSALFALNKPKLSDLKESVVNTLAYSAVFNAPIRVKECFLELQNMQCSYKQFQKALQELNSEYPDTVIVKDNYAGLKPYVKSINEYRRTFYENGKFIAKHQHRIRTIGALPWVSGVYFSGGTVHASHLDKQDLDLFVITKSNRVWPVYTMLKLISLFTRSKDLLCFNYLIDDDNLKVQSQQDLYTAHQILHLKPAIHNCFLPDVKAANPWIYDYFPNSRPSNSKVQEDSKISEPNKGNVIMEAINLLLMCLWGCFWKFKGVKNRTGGIRWDARQVKLHTHDHRPWVYNRYNTIKADIRQHMNEEQPDQQDIQSKSFINL